jgi:hypothetical protein
MFVEQHSTVMQDLEKPLSLYVDNKMFGGCAIFISTHCLSYISGSDKSVGMEAKMLEILEAHVSPQFIVVCQLSPRAAGHTHLHDILIFQHAQDCKHG